MSSFFVKMRTHRIILLSYLKLQIGFDWKGQSRVTLRIPFISMVRLLSPVVSFGATKPTGSGKRFTKQKTNMLIDMKQRPRQINEKIEKCFTNNIFANMLLINRVNSLCIYSLFLVSFSVFLCSLRLNWIVSNTKWNGMEYRNVYVHHRENTLTDTRSCSIKTLFESFSFK